VATQAKAIAPSVVPQYQRQDVSVADERVSGEKRTALEGVNDGTGTRLDIVSEKTIPKPMLGVNAEWPFLLDQ
jgi:hypothetical protein